MLAKLPKWFYASFRKHIEDTLEYELYFSGDMPNKDARIDVTIIGPRIEWIAKDQYQLEMMTNVLIKVPVEEDQEYLVHKMAGDCLAALLQNIKVYKYGDDGQQLDCMKIPDDKRRQVRYVHHGIVDTETELIQATVNCKHELILNLGD